VTEGTPPAKRRAYARFRNAVIDFSDDPSPDNLVRYLAASRQLDDPRRRRPSRDRSSDHARSRPG
jgi:hypothetical protein